MRNIAEASLLRLTQGESPFSIKKLLYTIEINLKDIFISNDNFINTRKLQQGSMRERQLHNQETHKSTSKDQQKARPYLPLDFPKTSAVSFADRKHDQTSPGQKMPEI